MNSHTPHFQEIFSLQTEFAALSNPSVHYDVNQMDEIERVTRLLEIEKKLEQLLKWARSENN